MDMIRCGGREECATEYDVAFDANGRISSFKAINDVNGGFTMAASAFACQAITGACNQVYDVANMKVKANLFLTNIATRTSVRGPGEIEASYVIETIIEHIAHFLKKDPIEVREVNFYSEEKKEDEMKAPNGRSLMPFTLPKMWSQLKASAKYSERREAINKFNAYV